MSSRIKVGVIFSSMMLTVMLVVGAVMGKSEETEGAYRPLAVYTDVLARIKSDYVEEPNIEQVTEGALQGLVEYIDPLSSYLSSANYKEYKSRLSSPDGGTGLSTGLVVHKRGNYTAVLSVVPDSPGDRAGIEPGDLIEAIDDASTRLMPPALIWSRLSGKPGEAVRLLVRPAREFGEPVEHRLERQKPVAGKVSSRLLDGGQGYIDVDGLSEGVIGQVAKAAKSLEKQGAKSLILDLRENALTEPKAGIALADLFIRTGRIASLKGQKSPEEVFEASDKNTASDLPLAVIVDRPASGGAEVAAAALLDSRGAAVVGENTYGLAARQETIELGDGAALILSTAKYYRPNGETLHGEGLEPNYPVEGSELRKFRDPEDPTPESQREDPYLKKALEALAARG